MSLRTEELDNEKKNLIASDQKVHELKVQITELKSEMKRRVPPKKKSRPNPSPNLQNVRITGQVLEFILENPNRFTQATNDQPPELCIYLKVNDWHSRILLMIIFTLLKMYFHVK